jgi:hypothetical protein
MPSGASDGSARCTMALKEPLRSEPQIERTFSVGMAVSPARVKRSVVYARAVDLKFLL